LGMTDFDLLGDPVPEGFGRRGRPPHVPDDGKRNKVIMLLGLGWQDPDIARALGITPPTLRKYYFRELRSRDDARLRLRATHLEALWEQCRAGNVAALKEFRRVMDRAESEDAQRDFLGEPVRVPRAPATTALGKKAQAAEEAKTAGVGTEWGGDLLPRTVN